MFLYYILPMQFTNTVLVLFFNALVSKVTSSFGWGTESGEVGGEAQTRKHFLDFFLLKYS